jgi:enamine deaminase RidA (YjgF/YER057c/UK114 family)
VLAKISAALAEVGASEADVVAMTVYLVAPPGAPAMDFAAMQRAYAKRYGTAEQPNRPARSTVEIAGLARPEFLVEIEVTAARPAR